MIKRLLMNLLLTFIWMMLTGMFAFVNFVFGFVLSFFILWVMARGTSDQRYFTRLPRIIGFVLFFLYELLKANLQVAFDVVTPGHNMKPGIVRVPLDATSDLEITLLANLITLTPGTLSLDVSDDKKALYVHALNIKNKEHFIKGIKTGFEKRLLNILR